MTNTQEALYQFIKENHPGYDECMVCKGIFVADNGKEVIEYYCVEKHKASQGDSYTINGRFWYDYSYSYKKCNRNWKIIYKSK